MVRHGTPSYYLNTLRPRQNGRHFTDAIFKCNFVNENVWIPIKISLKFVPESPINNIPALVQIMAWRRAGDKPLSEPMMISLPTHVCVTWPQWVNQWWLMVKLILYEHFSVFIQGNLYDVQQNLIHFLQHSRSYSEYFKSPPETTHHKVRQRH